MTAKLSQEGLCAIITDALKAATKVDALSTPVTMGSKMGGMREWDSLSFIAVFMAVGQAFDVELEDDDAIHFQSAQNIYDLLQEILEN